MFTRKKITYSGFSDYSNIKKLAYIAVVFVIIAVIWMAYFLIKHYSLASSFNLKGTIYYKNKPLSDVSVNIGGETAISDENGIFVVPHLKFGRAIIKFEKKGYLADEEKVFLWRKNQEIKKVVLARDEQYSASFSGIVLNNFDKKPIKDALIKLGDSSTISDERGEFEFIDMPKGDLDLEISAVGFWDLAENINLTALGSLSKEYDLTPYGRISFASTRDGKKNIYAINYDSKNLTNLTAKIKGDCWGGVFIPNGGGLVFYSDFEELIDQWGPKIPALYLFEKGNDKPRKISRDIIPEEGFKISQNGKRLVFSGKKKGEDKIEIYVISLDKRDEWIQLTDNELTESNLDISPDGAWIIYGAFAEGARGIYSQKVGAYNAEMISSSPNRELSLSYSPDGKNILYVRETLDFRSKIYVYNIDKKKEKEIYKTSANIRNIIWNKSSSKLAFTSTRDDKEDIYSINANGENEIKLTDSSADYKNILWPDAEKILVFITKKDGGNFLSIMDISKRLVKEIEQVGDDILSWDNEIFDTMTKEGL